MIKYTHSRLLAFIGVSFIILFCYLPFLFIFVPTYHDAHPGFIKGLVVYLTSLVFLIFLTYFFSVFSEPGYYRQDKSPMLNQFEVSEIKEESQRVKEEIAGLRKKLRDVQASKRLAMTELADSPTFIESRINFLFLEQLQKITYCFNCQHIKPLRCHHCKTCKQCVLRMDHHCPWTGNCVGETNLKFFTQFLFYASFALLTYFPFQAIFVLAGTLQIDSFLFTLIMFNSISSIIVGVPIAYLFYYQIQNMRLNLTTIEDNIEGVRRVAPFNQGFKSNLAEVVGPKYSIIDILLPTPVKFVHSAQLI